MSIDGLLLSSIKNELKESLINGRVRKIYQVSKYELLLSIHNRKKFDLFVSIHPEYARINITDNDFEKPNTPPQFCMVMRKHLEGAIIKDIKQVECDRILKIHFSTKNEFADTVSKYLIIEIMGKHSNVILHDEECKIIDAIKHLPPSQNSYRTILGGANYIEPLNEKILPFAINEDDWRNVINANSDIPINKQMVKAFQGISPLLAREIEFRINKSPLHMAYAVFKEVIDSVMLRPQPVIINFNDKLYFHLIELLHLNGTYKKFNSINELLDNFFYNKDKSDRTKQIHKELIKFVKNEVQKQENKLINLKSDLDSAEKSDVYEKYGQLILSNLFNAQISNGNVIVTDWYADDTPTILIPINQRLTLEKNAQKYFTKYKKAQTALIELNKQLLLTESEVIYFKSLLEQLEISTISDAEEIRLELEKNRYLRKSQITKQRTKNHKPNYSTYITDEDVVILVGRNNLQNEYITHKLAGRFEWWFHAKDAAGSHVIVRSNEESLSEMTIRTAAHLAAYFSKWRMSSSVPIDYTQVKNLKKVPGQKGSFVIYSNNKTIYIDPDFDLINSLKLLK